MTNESNEHRVALVMAASKGLGRACAEALAGSGHNLVLCARHSDTLEATATGLRGGAVQVETVAADVSQPEGIAAVFARAQEVFGRLDVLVANAGGPPPGSFLTATDEQWQSAFELTLMSAIRAMRLAVPAMQRGGFGRIVVIGSSSVKQPIDGLVLSNTFRPALVGAVKALAQETARDGITVNMVSPGRIDTDRVRALDEHRAAAQGVTYEEARAQAERNIPMGAYGQPSDLGALVAFLAGESARYITGQSIIVDGGLVSAI